MTDQLQKTLDAILDRLSALESQSGISPPPPSSSSSSPAEESEESAAVTAYKSYLSKSITPFTTTLSSLSPLSPTSPLISTIFTQMGSIITLASKCKRPKSIPESLAPHLLPIQTAIKQIRTLRLDRKYDNHLKAMMEMLASITWLIMSAPPAPTSFIKDTIGSTEFWSNKIRKEYKGKDDEEGRLHVAFCEGLKVLINDLVVYVKEYHLSGLLWNPRGVELDEYKVVDGGDAGSNVVAPKKDKPTSSSTTTTPKGAPKPPPKPAGDMMKELALRRTNDGNSAATGLKKVTRDQQTWRKEFKKPPQPSDSNPSSGGVVRPSQVKAAQKNISSKVTDKKVHQPVCRYQELGSKWFVEYQTMESNANGLCNVEVKSSKDQIYIYKCQNATIQIHGKVKSIILDASHKTNLIFSSAISSCEIVNCTKVQIQSTGLCPSFSIDKTDGCLIYLSKEGVGGSSFVTTKSSEMNVSWEDDRGEMRECPVPEQFVHRVVGGSVTSEVSDLYH